MNKVTLNLYHYQCYCHIVRDKSTDPCDFLCLTLKVEFSDTLLMTVLWTPIGPLLVMYLVKTWIPFWHFYQELDNLCDLAHKYCTVTSHRDSDRSRHKGDNRCAHHLDGYYRIHTGILSKNELPYKGVNLDLCMYPSSIEDSWLIPRRQEFSYVQVEWVK
jgi:hypothetical protein